MPFYGAYCKRFAKKSYFVLLRIFPAAASASLQVGFVAFAQIILLFGRFLAIFLYICLKNAKRVASESRSFEARNYHILR
jgi:hypothetical protein